MILVADSGSTKTDWMMDGEIITENGINPVTMSEEDILSHVRMMADDTVDEIFFYGAGCVEPFSEKVRKALLLVFPQAEVQVDSDLLGAARALCGHEPGIACILGTGSNSCLYDGERITDNIPPLGYVLGDEGSGAVLGKLFLNKLFKRELPQNICDAFFEWSKMTYAEIIDRVYRQPMANRFLASLSPFVHQQLDEPAIRILVYEHFNAFVRKNVMKYNRQDLPVNFVGSMADAYRDVLTDVLKANDLLVGKIIQRPIERLAEYHS